MSARERMFAGKLEANTSHRIRIRYLADVDTGMRVSFGGRILKITGIVNEDERNRFLDLICEEGAGS